MYFSYSNCLVPGIPGVLAISGLCYLSNRFANFLSRAFAAHSASWIPAPGDAELLPALWLAVMVVNAQRWKEKASAAGMLA